MKGHKRAKIGLALGSGGARGLALIGVLKVLEKNRIPIDIIAGTSIGAMVGGFYAAGLSLKEMEKIALETNWKLLLSLIDPQLKQGLIGGDKVKGYIEKYISQVLIENCRVPFAAVATDLKSGQTVRLTKGDLATAIRASISIPVVFKPVEIGGITLADGGLSEPVPVETARAMGADIVIAVNLDNREGQELSLRLYDIADNSFDILRHHLALQNMRDADAVVTPKVYGTRWHKFLEGPALIGAGEKAAKAAMQKIEEVISNKNKSGFEKILNFLNS